jgi:transcriptional regulator with XRE-family HTH domain
LRIERGLTQEALALESGVTRNVLIHVEHGKRGLLFERLYDLAEVLGVPAGDLLLVDDPGLNPKRRNSCRERGAQ